MISEVRTILEERNRRLLQDVRTLIQLVQTAHVPAELLPYRNRVEEFCHQAMMQVEQNLTRLALGRDDILPDIMSDTTLATWKLRLLGGRLAPPVLRASETDRLSLSVIGWVHAAHPETKDYPAALGDGEVAIRPFLRFRTPLYFFPSVEQRGLLYQPLWFHEFGHLLYARHKPELDDLVGELQRRGHDTLLPASQRNNRHAVRQARQRQTIVNAWYQWTQEFFCDAVGFTIGGPCFLRVFSTYLSQMTEADFYRSPEDLRASSHPVTWLRIQFLNRRAEEAGFGDLARSVDEEWRAVADVLGVREEYDGYYVDALQETVERILADMLTEAGPRPFTEAEAVGDGWSPTEDSPVRLLNWAWQIQTTGPEAYGTWEAEQVARLVGE